MVKRLILLRSTRAHCSASLAAVSSSWARPLCVLCTKPRRSWLGRQRSCTESALHCLRCRARGCPRTCSLPRPAGYPYTPVLLDSLLDRRCEHGRDSVVASGHRTSAARAARATVEGGRPMVASAVRPSFGDWMTRCKLVSSATTLAKGLPLRVRSTRSWPATTGARRDAGSRRAVMHVRPD